eukprot:CAMPEP_0178423112 /NCGR_PEP_ID=MMETSP0689_2-20121128/27522_1 /TAXON_ID=160604 /ORGANISM="Amphidinium massartii, Strain CS-259" /LENGTH=275 /DNA_ID=CAMNT_0020044699 /DNA_START=72 /DNA_END=899 /DNA_ORIENTATION=+
MANRSIVLKPRESLYVSEPEPWMFGNERNPPKGTEGWTNSNWLKSRFHFSFAEYYDGPSQFGVLRVMNDDLVQPARGFGTHPHRDMEIITFVVEGSLTHQDSMGTSETLGRGSVQFMTAGTGVRHSEHNLDPVAPLRFIQTWILPRRRGLRPNYGSMCGSGAAAEARKDKWAHLVADAESPDPDAKKNAAILIQQDCNAYVTELSAGKTSPPLEVASGRQAYVLCVEGEVQQAGTGEVMRQHDAAEIMGASTLELAAGPKGALVLVFEMAQEGRF